MLLSARRGPTCPLTSSTTARAPADPGPRQTKKAAFPRRSQQGCGRNDVAPAGGRRRFCPRESSLSSRRARRVKPVDRNQSVKLPR